MRQYEFSIPGDPVGKQRGRTFMPPGGKFPVTTTPPKTRNFEALVKLCATQAGVTPMSQCTVKISIAIPVRLIEFKTKADRIEEPRRRPDIDNVVKSVCDALNGIAYRDDKDILQITAGYVFIDAHKSAHTNVQIYERDWTEFMEATL